MPVTKSRLILVSVAALVAAGATAWLIQTHRDAQETTPVITVQAPPTASTHSSLPLLPVVKQIIKDGPSTPYLKLNYVIKELPTDLAPHDISALLTFITSPRPQSFTEGEWGSLTNDIQEALSVQTVPNREVARVLIQTFRDQGQSQMMRDYALQHIGGFAIYLVHTAHTRDGSLPPFFNDLTKELLTATTDSTRSWAGTAFNLLDGLLRAAQYRSIQIPGITPEALASLAVPLASNPKAPLNARLPALHVASRHKAPEALVQARAILADPKANIMLVQSAAAVIAEQGSKDDVPRLEQALAANRQHTQVALQTALKRLKNL